VDLSHATSTDHGTDFVPITEHATLFRFAHEPSLLYILLDRDHVTPKLPAKLTR
jgi:hypothetical protein